MLAQKMHSIDNIQHYKNEINKKYISQARLLNFNRKGGKKLFYHFFKIHLTKNYTFINRHFEEP